MRALLFCLTLLLSAPARAEFIISSAIIEFTGDGPRQRDIELVSRSAESDYIVSEVSEIADPGLPSEKRVPVTEPGTGGLLVTPDKTVLAAGSRRLLRFVLLEKPGARERVYRIAIKPVIKGVENTGKVGLKILIGYEVLAIVRPAVIAPAYTASRHGRTVTIANSGNVNVVFQNGQQCPEEACKLPPVARVYPGGTAHIELPLDKPVTYSIWDGRETVEKTY